MAHFSNVRTVFVCFAECELRICILKLNVIACFFSVNLKLFFEFFVMHEKANYLYMKLLSEEVQYRGPSIEFISGLTYSVHSIFYMYIIWL